MNTISKIEKSKLNSKPKQKRDEVGFETSLSENQLKVAISASELKKRTTDFLIGLDWKK